MAEELTQEEIATLAKIGISDEEDVLIVKERIASDKKARKVKEINNRYAVLIRAKNDEITTLNQQRETEIAELV
jgi:hypothetical protein